MSYQYDNAVDYYAGRVTCDVLSMIGGSSSIVSGLGTIIGSVLGGGAITVSSGGVLVVGGGAIVIEGVIGGTAQVTYGGMILLASAKNFGDDFNKLREASNTKKLGDANAKDLKPLPKNKIKELGGEDYTQPIKRDGGRSKSNLYWNSKTGDVYSVPNNGGIPQWVDNIPTN